MAETFLGDAAAGRSSTSNDSEAEGAAGDLGSDGLSRRELLTLVSAIMAMMAVGIDLMLPAFDDIELAYNLEGSGQIGQTITVFFFGLAVAQLVHGPLADALGRKAVLYLSTAIFTAGAVASALAPTFALLLVARFVWGLGAAGGRVVAIAILRDRFEGVAMAKAMSQVMAVFVLVPIFAPTLGAGIILVLPWRAVFWTCAGFAGVIALWSLRLEETLKPSDRRPLDVRTTMRGYAEVARTPVTFGYTMAGLFLQAVFTAYLAASESIVDEVFDLGSRFPMIFGAVAMLFGIAALVNGRVVERQGIDRVVRRALQVMLSLSVVLIVVAVSGDGVPSIWLYMPILGLILSMSMFLMPNLGSASMVPVGHIAGSASAYTGALRIAGGALMATMAAGWLHASTVRFAVWVLGCCTAAAVCVVLVRRGQQARAEMSTVN